MKPILRWLGFAAILAVIVLPFVALAQAAIPDPTDPGPYLGAILSALKGGDYQVVVALGLMGFVYALRKWGLGWVPWFKTDEGGAVLLLLVTVAGGFSAVLFAHEPLTWAIVGKIFLAGFGAGGVWGTVRKLLRAFGPLLEKIPGVGGLLAKVAAWLSGGDVAQNVQATADANYKPASPGSGPSVAESLDRR